MAAAVPKARWRVAAIEKERSPWCVPLPNGSSVGDLQRAVEIRENMLREEAGEPGIFVGIELRLDGDQCAVHPSDLLLDLIPECSEDSIFVATCKAGRDAVAPSRAAAAASAAATAPAPAAGAVATPGLVETTKNLSQKPTADVSPFMGFVFPSMMTTSCVGPESLNTGLLAMREESAPQGGETEESDRATAGPRTFNHALFSHGLAVSSTLTVEAAAAAPAPAPAPAAPTLSGGRASAPLGPTPGATFTEQHRSSVNAPEGRQETTWAGCGGARATAASAGPATAAAISQAFLLPLAPFRSPEHPACTSLGSSSKESSTTSSTGSNVAAAALETSDTNGHDAECLRPHGWDDEADAMCLDNSSDAGSFAATFSPPPSKKARNHVGNNLQLLPRSASMSMHQAAATIVLAAAMLGGGTPAQQSEAEGFVASELANHDKDLSSRLVAYLRSTVEVENDGAICVVLAKVSDICGIRESHQGFCFTRYMVGNDYLVSDIHVGRPQACLGSAYRLVAGEAGSGSLLERWKVGGARVFKWKSAPMPTPSPAPKETRALPAPRTASADEVARLGSAASGEISHKKGQVPGSSPQLLPRSAIMTQLEATEMVVLAAAMLRGGTSNQQREAEAFVEAELAKHDKDVSDRLTEKLKEIVKLNEDGVWVGRKDLPGLCWTHQNPLGFYGVTRYLVGESYQKRFERSKANGLFWFSQ